MGRARAAEEETQRQRAQWRLERARRENTPADIERYGREQFYIRFGDVPEGERSEGYILGESFQEMGVSVYDADWDKNFLWWDLNLPGGESGPGTMASLLGGDRPIYLVQGKQVGEGADGEPLLRDVKTVKRLNVWDVMSSGIYDPTEHEEIFPT